MLERERERGDLRLVGHLRLGDAEHLDVVKAKLDADGAIALGDRHRLDVQRVNRGNSQLRNA